MKSEKRRKKRRKRRRRVWEREGWAGEQKESNEVSGYHHTVY